MCVDSHNSTQRIEGHLKLSLVSLIQNYFFLLKCIHVKHCSTVYISNACTKDACSNKFLKYLINCMEYSSCLVYIFRL